MPHLTQVGQRWGLVGICKVEQSNAPPLGTTSQHKSPTNPLVLPLARLNNFLRCEYYGVTQYTCMYETNFFANAPTLGTILGDKSYTNSTWGRCIDRCIICGVTYLTPPFTSLVCNVSRVSFHWILLYNIYYPYMLTLFTYVAMLCSQSYD